MGLVHEHAGKAHFRTARPQLRRIAFCVATIAQRAQVCDRGFGGKEAARAVAQHALLFIQDERHWKVPF